MTLVGKIFSVVFIVLHLCTVLFGDSGHTDDILRSLQSIQTLTADDCGAHEHHHDVPPIHGCLACYRAANSTARISAASFISTPFSFTEFFVPPLLTPFKSIHYYSSGSKRGPPSL